MKPDKRMRKHVARLIDADETIVAAPMTQAFASARNIYTSSGVAGRLMTALNLEPGPKYRGDLGEMVVLTDRRLLFCELKILRLLPKPTSISYAIDPHEVTLQWAEGSVSGIRWMALNFMFSDGTFRIVEAQCGSAIRRASPGEPEMMIAGFGDRATEIAIEGP